MLRERIPDFVPALEVSEAVVALPRARQGVSVAFRSGGDLSDVVRAIREHKFVDVEAAPGSGKSTVLPYDIAGQLGRLVVHVFPNERMADDIARYSSSIGSVNSVLLTTRDPFPRDGVACVAAPVLVAKWLEAGTVVMPDCVLYHDEAHESDAFTYLVKRLAWTCENVLSYVRASATHGATGFRGLELPGKLRVGAYEGSVSSWDPYDEGKPWSINSFGDNAALFVDSKTAAANLVEQYASAGFLVYRLHSRMRLEAFRVAMAALRNVSGPVVVLVADSSHRSGFTFQVGSIVDSGEIGYLDVSSGRPIRCKRPIYELERLQTSARGARVPGSSTLYWTPLGLKGEPAICDLMPVEAEAVALIMRMLGFEPPREFSGCRMFSGGVPRDLCAALQSDQPLGLLRDDQLVSVAKVVKPDGRRSPFLSDKIDDAGPSPIDVLDPRVSADTARKSGRQRYSMPESQHLGAWQDDLREMLSPQQGVSQLQMGKAYYATGLVTDSDESVVVFPDGAMSVLRMADEADGYGALAGLDPWHKSVAVNLLLAKQGALAAETDGIQRAVAAARKDHSMMGTPAARALATQLAQRLAVATSQMSFVLTVLQRMGNRFCSYHEMDINTVVSDAVYESWMSAWQALPRAENRGRLHEFAIGRESVAATRRLGEHVQRQIVDKSYVPMPSFGRGMRTITSTSVKSSSSGSISEDDRCTGSTYWQEKCAYRDGRLCKVRDLVCEYCGVGASARKHGMKRLSFG